MARRNPWVVVATGVFALLCVLIAGVAGYWHYANQLPVYPPPNIVMPVPNAYDDYVAAAQMCEAAGGATVAAEGSGAASTGNSGRLPGYPGRRRAAPARGSGQQRQAFEPDVPLAQVRAVVARNRPALARLRQGFRKQYRSPPLVSASQMFPELAQFRELARVLVTEGKLAERQRRPDDAARSYLDCLRLGIDVPRGGPLIHGLVGIAVQSIALRPLQGLADRLGGPTAAAAAREMARLDAQAPSLADTLSNEKEGMTASLLQMLRQPGGWRQMFAGMFTSGSSGAPSADEIWLALRFTFTPKRRMLDNVRGYMDALSAGSRRPYYAPAVMPPIPGDPLSQIVLPVFDQARFRWVVMDAQWRITELRLATRAYQQQHGTPPPSLEALVPAYLPAVPQDPFAPKPLVYRRTGTAALIYSRGPDGKDDGGKDLGARVNPDSRGDIVSMGSLKKQ
jgi:hypothetical protein